MDDQANVVGARPSAAERPQESGAAALGRGGRMSRQRKTAAVLRTVQSGVPKTAGGTLSTYTVRRSTGNGLPNNSAKHLTAATTASGAISCMHMRSKSQAF